MAHYVLNGIIAQLDHGNNPVVIPGVITFFETLHFFVSGTYQRVLGRSFDLSVSQQSMSKAIQEVIIAITNTFSQQWVHFPRTREEKLHIRERFIAVRNFPGVIGAVDCTHTEIIKPNEEEHIYLNRKGFHSKNVQIVCDHDLKILNINTQFGGATHDAFIWRNSLVRAELKANYQRGERNVWLLGDSGYPQEPWLMTPILNALPGSPDSRYTETQIQARNCVERYIGVFKGRFLCLSKILKYSPEKVGHIANTCAILHNICIAARLEEDFNIPPANPEPNEHQYIPLPNEPYANREGNIVRRKLIQRHFTN